MKNSYFFILSLLWIPIISVVAQDRDAAGLSEAFRWQGRGNWSINGIAVEASNPVGGGQWVNHLPVVIPEGAEVEAAFLYAAIGFQTTSELLGSGPEARPRIRFDERWFEPEEFVRVGRKPPVLSGFRVDVSEYLRNRIRGARGLLRFPIQEEDLSEELAEKLPEGDLGRITHGTALVVIYSHPDEKERLIILNDGAALDRETLTIPLTEPLDATIPGFEALLSVGVSNSSQSNQVRDERNGFTEIRVGGKLLTKIAGGADDGFKAGVTGPAGTTSLITVGGEGDDAAPPLDPSNTTLVSVRSSRTDDELYDLAQLDPNGEAWVRSGEQVITLDFQRNSDRQTNLLFFAGLNVVTDAAPSQVPTPGEEMTVPEDDPNQYRPAAFTEVLSWQGRGNWSIDAIGKGPLGESTGNDGVLHAKIPLGSRVEHAFLYCTLERSLFSDMPVAPILLFSGHLIGGSDWTTLDPFGSNGFAQEADVLRADVTTQVRERVGNGATEPIEFAVVENERWFPGEGEWYRCQGEALVVVYSHPNESERSLYLADGMNLPRAWESVTVEALNAIDPADPGFEAHLSLGIAGSDQSSPQLGNATAVRIGSNGAAGERTLTQAAGGADDAYEEALPGRRITIGGFGDQPNNPDASAYHEGNASMDDELYNLAEGAPGSPTPFLAAPFDLLQVSVRNPSLSDVVFFIGINMTSDEPLQSAPHRALGSNVGIGD